MGLVWSALMEIGLPPVLLGILTSRRSLAHGVANATYWGNTMKTLGAPGAITLSLLTADMVTAIGREHGRYR